MYNRGKSRSFEMAPFDRSHTSFYWRTTVTAALSFIVSEIKRDIGRKSRFFHTPRASEARVKGTPSEFRQDISYEKKLEWLGYQKLKNFEDMYTRSDKIHEHDGSTAGQHGRVYA